MTTTATPTGRALARLRALRHPSLLPIAVGLGAATISAIGSWIPSFWSDEGASIMSAQRSWPELFAMLRTVDVVHGVYYALLHFWIQLGGTSEFWVRLPSALAVGAAAAGLVILGDLIGGQRLGLIAAGVFAVMPRTTYMGAEARSYALSAAVVVWLVVAFLVAAKSGRTRHWVAYAALLAFGTYLFLYSVLMAVALGFVVWLRRAEPGVLRRWAWATGIAGFAVLPIVAWGSAQHGQIAYLAGANDTSPWRVGVDQWFGNLQMAIVGWSLLAFAVGFLVRDLRHGLDDPRTRARVLGLSWALVPLIVLLVANLVIPVYTVRYLSFATPGVALAIASVLVLVRPPQLVVVLVLWAVLAVPTYLYERGPFAKGGADFRQVSEVIAAHAAPGDAVVFDEHTRHSWRPRLAMRIYPAAFAGLRDVTLAEPYWRSTGLWDVVDPVNQVAGSVLKSDTVWDIRISTHPFTARYTDAATLLRLGYRVVATYPVSRDTVYELSRSAP